MTVSPTVRIIFITGTDTGVGKTLLTALLLTHLRQTGHLALALKPFCSGSRADPKLLHSLQFPGASKVKNQKSKIKNPFSLDQINPFYFPESVAPLVAAREHHHRITLQDALDHLARIVSSINPVGTLLIEGAGGLLAPLGENFNLLDVITHVINPASFIKPPASVQVLLVARNQLGTINHTLLTTRVLAAIRTTSDLELRPSFGARLSDFGIPTRVILMDPARFDHSSSSNPRVLFELLAPSPVFSLPYLGSNCCNRPRIRALQKKLHRTLSRILA